MNRRFTTIAPILTALCFLMVTSELRAADARAYTEEFHQTYSLAAGGRVELDNINGAVHITGWDRNEVKVDAIKYASRKERLDQAQIQVDASSDRVSIRTEYRDHDLTFNHDDNDNPASVEYTLTVPRNARLDQIKLINGSLDIAGVSGEVHASCINGRLAAHDLVGRVKLSTINSKLDAQFQRLDSPIDLGSVNGSVLLTLPSDAKAEVSASTVSGTISNDFGMRVRSHPYVGHDLHGQLAGGGTYVRLSNVNGRIEIRHAGDNRAMSPVKDLTSGRDNDSKKDSKDDRDSDDEDDEM